MNMPENNGTESPMIEFYDGFENVSSFKSFVTSGDLGGTKERLALYGRDDDGKVERLIRATWFGTEVDSVKDMFVEFHEILQGKGLTPPKQAVLGCAGVIQRGGTYCKFTNIDLEVSTAELETIGVRVELINDFFANAQQVPFLTKEDWLEIPHNSKSVEQKAAEQGANQQGANQQGANQQGANQQGATEQKDTAPKTMVVLGPGSGLGVAPVFWDEGEETYYSQPSEGGHKAWSPRNDFEWALYKYLRDEVAGGRDPDAELVASGKGLTNVVRFLCYGNLLDGATTDKIKALRQKEEFPSFVASLHDAPPQVAGRRIIQAFKDKEHRAALKCAVSIFVDAVAAAARDAVHDFCAYGGVYLSGGNARRLRKQFLSGRFMEIFDESYEHTDKLRQTPVYLVTSRTLGIDGAARYAFSKIA